MFDYLLMFLLKNNTNYKINIQNYYIKFCFLQLSKRLNLIDIFRKLQSEPASFWLNLLNKQFVDAPFVFTKGIPSIKKKIEMTKEEEERIEKQKQKLGVEGLKKKEKELEDAIAENEVIIPLQSNFPKKNYSHPKNFNI